MWYYTINGQQQGPVDEMGLDQLLAVGTITPDTFVWRDGMANWTALSLARTPRGAITTGDPALSTCTICNKQVGEQNLIQLLGNRVCATCKPTVLQSMREGAQSSCKKWQRLVRRQESRRSQRDFTAVPLHQMQPRRLHAPHEAKVLLASRVLLSPHLHQLDHLCDRCHVRAQTEHARRLSLNSFLQSLRTNKTEMLNFTVFLIIRLLDTHLCISS